MSFDLDTLLERATAAHTHAVEKALAARTPAEHREAQALREAAWNLTDAAAALGTRLGREKHPALSPEIKRSKRSYKVADPATTFFESEAAEIVADPEGHGVSGEELWQYQLANALYEDGRLYLPESVVDLETLGTLLVHAANSEDERAEYGRDVEERKEARLARDALTGLMRKVRRNTPKRGTP